MFARHVVVGVLLTVGSVSQALACSTLGPEPTREELFRKASAVIAAHMIRTEEVEARLPRSNRQQMIVEGTFRVVEVLKGTPPSDLKIKSFTFGPGNCTVPILSGADYVLFLHDDEQGFVSWPGGTQMLWSFETDSSQQLLNELRALKN